MTFKAILGSSFVLAILANCAIGQEPKPAAVVNGANITMADVDSVLAHAGPTATPLTEAQKRQRRVDALGLLIDDVLIEQFLRKNAPKVGPDAVNRKLVELQEIQRKQGKTMNDLLKETGQTEVQLRAAILSMLQWTAYLKEHLSDAEVKRYYDESRDFFDRVSVRASHIVLRIAPNASDAEKQAIRARLQALRQEIVTGKIDFAEAAKKHSQDATATSGGDLGYFQRKFAVDETFARAAFALKPGEISDLVETGYGAHLILVTDRKPGQPSDFNKMKDEIREFYGEELRFQVLAEERKNAHVEINMP
jgi:peptidyl-prolyl cis-trans isomerase C